MIVSDIERVMAHARLMLADKLNPDTGELADLAVIERIASSALNFFNTENPTAKVCLDDVISGLRTEYTITQDAYALLTDDGKNHVEWWYERRMELGSGLHYWNRYRDSLSNKIAAPIVERLDRLTDRTLGLLEDPRRDGEWDRRGLVVGQVQSGKTSNYIGLVCKAVDAGYKLIVVLAGMHNNLRSQTQLRLDEGFLGFDTAMNLTMLNTSSRIGVGLIRPQIPNQAMSLTTNAESGDFRKERAQNAGIPLGQMPTLLVVKKHKGILDGLISWARSVKGKKGLDNRYYIDDVPILLIDDEADNASVNTKKDDIAAINGKLRELLQLFRKSAYVGYTATPFANVFIDPEAEHEGFGKDIYPESFIINIPAPSNYFGPLRVFGLKNDQFSSVTEGEALPLVLHVDSLEAEQFFPAKHKRDLKVVGLPSDMVDAVKSFLISIAARRARGQIQVHNSMLIHVTRFVDVQNQVKDLLQDTVDELRRLVEYGDMDTLVQLEEKWRKEFQPVTSHMLDEFKLSKLDWHQIRSELPKAVAGLLPVKAINGSAKDILDYTKHPKGVSVICVGGDKLARGLTLEGLTISYFTRPARMYDTLMQMGRWFGYRTGYEDLCRLYTTSEIALCFEHVTLASEELRQQFDQMESRGGSPRDYGHSVRTSPHGMLITSLGKMRSAIKLDLSFANHLIETYHFKRDSADIESNLKLADQWLTGLAGGPDRRTHPYASGFVWHSTSGEVMKFLRSYSSPLEAWRSDGKLLSEYIASENEYGRLKKWTVALLNPMGVNYRYPGRFGGLDSIGIFSRSDINKGDPGQPYTLSKGRLGSKLDETLGLDQKSWGQVFEPSQSDAGSENTQSKPQAIRMRAVREADGGTGLIMIYLIVAKEPPPDPKLPTVAFAVSFPPSSGGSTISVKVTKDYVQREFGFTDEDDDGDD